MQDYHSIAEKNGVVLVDTGQCQFCGASTSKGVFECLEIFNLSFQNSDFTVNDHHLYRFLIVDAHALQHPEIHGRWSNHFHLSRLHLIFNYNVTWTYRLSSKLSAYLNTYKTFNPHEYLVPPKLRHRGGIHSQHILDIADNDVECKALIIKWAAEVHESWNSNATLIDELSKGFLSRI